MGGIFGFGNVTSERKQYYYVSSQQIRGGTGIMGNRNFVGGAKAVEKSFSPTFVTNSPGAETTGATVGGMEWKSWAILGVAIVIAAWIFKR